MTPPVISRTVPVRILAACLAATCLLAALRGCTAPATSSPDHSATAPLASTAIGLADRDIVKAKYGMTDPALLQQQIHDQVIRDAWLRLPAYTQGVAFTLDRSSPTDPPHIAFTPIPLPSSAITPVQKADFVGLGTGTTRGAITFAPTAAVPPTPPALTNAPLYKVIAGYPLNPPPGQSALPLLAVHDLAIDQCYRAAIQQHLAATHQENLLHATGRILPMPDLRTWTLDVPAGESAPGETTTGTFDRHLCRMEMTVRVHLAPASAAPPATLATPRPASPATDRVDHAARGCPVTLARPYLPNYSGGGPGALTDGLLASSVDLGDPAWQAIQGDLEATIDLGRPVDVRVLCSRFFQHSDAAVILPAEVQYWLSSDGKDFQKVATVTNIISIDETQWIKEFWFQLDKPHSARFVRVIARQNPAAGKSWLFADELLVNPLPRRINGQPIAAQPIRGTWIVLDSSDATTEYWQKTVADCAALGMKYLVIHFVAMNGQAFYASDIIPRAKQKCPDPLEAVMAAADNAGLKVFVSNGFTARGESSSGSPQADDLRRKVTREIAAKYAHHTSFYGWYFPDEAAINGHFPVGFADYIHDCSTLARKLTPKARLLIAPYGTRLVDDDQQFRDQLRNMDIDIIAYQDEVGCNRVGAYDDDWIFRRLAKIHHDVPKVELWAELESFDLQKTTWTSPQFPRVQAQIENLSPFVKNILIYRYTETMARTPKANDPMPAPFPLLADYRAWLTHHHPDVPRP